MKAWRRATVVALLLGLWGLALWGGQMEENAGRWFEPDVPVTLYFGALDAQGVTPEVRWLPRSESTPMDRLEALIAGPQSPQLVESISRSTVIRSLHREGDLIVVDFDRKVIEDHPGGSAGEIITVFAVTNTLTEIPGVRRVAWRVEGRPVETLVGHLDLSRPVKRNEDVIVPR